VINMLVGCMLHARWVAQTMRLASHWCDVGYNDKGMREGADESSRKLVAGEHDDDQVGGPEEPTSAKVPLLSPVRRRCKVLFDAGFS
jgi:hypothetical protein